VREMFGALPVETPAQPQHRGTSIADRVEVHLG
jgi:hypothetical protein